jgi:TetR/AcrR family transcriptional regulator, copper-responsive repressor
MSGVPRLQKNIELFSSLSDNTRMGRRKNFSREEMIERAIPVFWKRGFSHTTLEALERATGVNKSGLYSEFRDKEDLFVECLRYYLASQAKRRLLTEEPLGWKNIETFLKLGPHSKEEQKGCFSISSMREFAILPDEAHTIVAQSRATVKRLVVKNIEAEGSRMDPESVAEIVLVFFSGLCIEHNLKSRENSRARKIESLMKVLRSL